MKPALRGFLEDRLGADGTAIWFKRKAGIQLPRDVRGRTVIFHLTFTPPRDGRRQLPPPRSEVWLDGTRLGVIEPSTPGAFQQSFQLPPGACRNGDLQLRHSLSTLHGWYAWFGRVLARFPLLAGATSRLKKYRDRTVQRSLGIQRVLVDDRVICDFTDGGQSYLPHASDKELNLGVNVCACFSLDNGISEGARASLRSLQAARVPARQIDAGEPLPTERWPVSVFHADAPQMSALAVRHPALFAPDQYRIGYWAWELPVFPATWMDRFAHVDEVWVPSRFTFEAVSARSPVPVLIMPHAVDVPPPGPVDRAEFGLPRDAYLFLVLYDLDSYQERKNPAAAIHAYRRAFGGLDDVGLVIKVHHGERHDAARDNLQRLVDNLPGVRLLDETFSREKLTRLQAACDCYVSLHRAEGFGLCVAEAMALGKPVIATNWSAPAEFLSTDNSIPVDYKLVTLERDHGPYRKGQVWADPSLDHAVEAMRRLHRGRDLGVRLGRQAEQTIRERFSPTVIGRQYRARLETIARWRLAEP
ncbi:MAG TPA: glycosyltransferase [Verrucomicrobiae bacterium]|nr:glycosyltransferase [Verrucomicrobiae bacterium]